MSVRIASCHFLVGFFRFAFTTVLESDKLHAALWPAITTYDSNAYIRHDGVRSNVKVDRGVKKEKKGEKIEIRNAVRSNEASE